MIRRLFAGLLFLILFQGCAGGQGLPGLLETPRVSVAGVQIQSLSFNNTSALISLDVTNPNAFAIPVEGISYALALGDASVAEGQQVQRNPISALGSTRVDVPVTMNFQQLVNMAPALLSGRMPYNLSGSVQLPFVAIPFEQQGAVSLSDVIRAGAGAF